MANTTDVEVVRYIADVSQLDARLSELERHLLAAGKAGAQSANQLGNVQTQAKAAAGSIDFYSQKIEELTKDYKSLSAEERKGALGKTIASNIKDLNKALDSASTKLNTVEKELKGVGKEASNTGGILSKIGPQLAAFFSIGAVIAFGKQVFNVTSEFQKLEAVLTNTLGSSSLAQKALADIRNFAAVTPFSVQELTQSYVKLANQGFKPTVNQLRQLGDLASSTGKGFDQLTEAIIDAQTGEFERLKEFGIRASKEGDKVTFTFKGVKTQTDFTNQSIRDYITSLGDLEGVSGSMAAISGTLEGQISNLGDSFDKLFNTLGQQGAGIFSGFISNISQFVNFLSTGLRSEQQVINDNTQKFIDKQAQILDKGAQHQIDVLVLNGEKRITAEREIFDKISKENAELADLSIQNNKNTQQEIIDDTRRLAQLRADGEFGEGEKSLVKRIQQNKKILRVAEANYATQIFLRDDYASKVNAIDQKTQQDADAAAALAAKNAKKLADAAKKAFDLQEQQRRAYNDFSISLIENQFDRETAAKKEQFFRTIEDSKKNIGQEILTNSEEYKRLSDALINDLKEIEKKRKDFNEKAEAERVKAILDSVNKQITALESAQKNIDAVALKKLRDQYEAQLVIDGNYKDKKHDLAVAREQLDNQVAIASFNSRKKTLNDEIDLISNEIVKQEEGSKAQIALKEQLTTKINELDNLEFSERERLRNEDLKKEKLALQQKQILQQAAINVVTAALNAAIDLRQQALTAEIQTEQQKLQQDSDAKKAAIDKQVEYGYISQKKATALKAEVDKAAAKKEQDLKLRQFKADQQAAVSRALLGIASGIINAFATLPYPAALIASAGIAAVGAIEIGVIKSQKPPKFKDGVIGFKGKGTDTSDDNHVMISNNESVVTARATKKFTPELKAMEAGTFESLMKQKYSTEAMSFLPFEREQTRKKAEYKTASERESERRNRESSLDLSKMEMLTKRNGAVAIRNAEEIGKAVARNLPSNTRYRA